MDPGFNKNRDFKYKNQRSQYKMSEFNNPFSSKYGVKSITGGSIKELSSLQNDKKPSRIVKSFQKIQIQIKNQNLDDLLQVYSWRSKAQLPIVKVLFYKVLQKNPIIFQTTIEVSYQSCPFTLSDFNEISLSNLLYLLKQSIIGFEKLFSVFGSFLISNKMIGINKNNKCKVWINENYAVNEPIDVEMFKNQSEKQFLQHLISLLNKKSQKTKLTELLYSYLNQCQSFQYAATSINKFCKDNKIEIGNTFKIEQINEKRNHVSRSPLKNPNQMTNISLFGDKQKILPKFLNKSQTGQLKETNANDSIIKASKITQRMDKSKSINKLGARQRTPLIHNRSQANLNNIFKSPKKISFKYDKKEDENEKLDCSFQNKVTYSSRLLNKKSDPLTYTSTSIQNTLYDSKEEKSFLFKNKNYPSTQQILKSDVNSTNTQSSFITTRTRSLLEKKQKPSLFQADKDLIESIIIGNEHDKPNKNLFSTMDLKHLGKLGKQVIQSCMPEDFTR